MNTQDMLTTDLNADLGEGAGNDRELMAIVSSCNIACGGHAGAADSMSLTLELARQHDVVPGAHPSYPDREHFGRRSRFLTGDELYRSLGEQVATLAEIAKSSSHQLAHLKPHGALYNDAAGDEELANIVARVADDFGLALLGPPASELAKAAAEAGTRFVPEGFVDRLYLASGRLSPRDYAGAVLSHPDAVAGQAISLVLDKQVLTADGSMISLDTETLCIHSDTPGAVDLARHVRSALVDASVHIRAHDL